MNSLGAAQQHARPAPAPARASPPTLNRVVMTSIALYPWSHSAFMHAYADSSCPDTQADSTCATSLGCGWSHTWRAAAGARGAAACERVKHEHASAQRARA